MSVTPDLINTHILNQPRSTTLANRILPAMLAASIGFVLLYGAAFANVTEVHNAAHDGRHSAGFPCH